MLNINKLNSASILPVFRSALKQSSFVAIDFQLTGLIDNQPIQTFADTLETRYSSLQSSVRTYSIVQMGVCCAKVQGSKTSYTPFNIFVNPFYKKQRAQIIARFNGPTAKFLSQNSFDFNQAFQQGVSFNTSSPKDSLFFLEPKSNNFSLMKFCQQIQKNSSRLVLHNGWYDIGQFMNALGINSKSFNLFTKVIFSKFQQIYDTKYMLENHSVLFQKANYQSNLSESFKIMVPKEQSQLPEHLHNAGYDAYMTALLFNACIKTTNSMDFGNSLKSLKNRIKISGLKVPLSENIIQYKDQGLFTVQALQGQQLSKQNLKSWLNQFGKCQLTINNRGCAVLFFEQKQDQHQFRTKLQQFGGCIIESRDGWVLVKEQQ